MLSFPLIFGFIFIVPEKLQELWFTALLQLLPDWKSSCFSKRSRIFSVWQVKTLDGCTADYCASLPKYFLASCMKRIDANPRSPKQTGISSVELIQRKKHLCRPIVCKWKFQALGLVVYPSSLTPPVEITTCSCVCWILVRGKECLMQYLFRRSV